MKTHAEADGVPRAFVSFRGYPFSHAHRGDSPRLRHHDPRVRPTSVRDGILEDVLRALRGLTTAGAAGDHHDGVGLERFAQLFANLLNRELIADLAHLSLGAGGVRVDRRGE